MNHNQEELARITGILLEPGDNDGKLPKAMDDLNRLFWSISGLEMERYEYRENVYLSHGKAIGPVWAAMCIKDNLRTKKFIRGIQQGIQHALEKFPSRPVHILYAGTGPFAALAVPLTTVFESEEIRFTFLEINPLSINLLKKMVAAFEIGPYLYDIKQGDASNYQVDEDKPIHIIITETMQNALQKEPQAAITLNLVPQMLAGGILIPQNILVEAALLDPEKDMERMTGSNRPDHECYFPLGKIFELNMDFPSRYLTTGGSGNSCAFPDVEIVVPKGIPEGFKHFSLFTTIQVFKGELLKPWQCSLTLPKRIRELDRDKNAPDKISFQYVMNEKPGFEFKIDSNIKG